MNIEVYKSNFITNGNTKCRGCEIKLKGETALKFAGHFGNDCAQFFLCMDCGKKLQYMMFGYLIDEDPSFQDPDQLPFEELVKVQQKLNREISRRLAEEKKLNPDL